MVTKPMTHYLISLPTLQNQVVHIYLVTKDKRHIQMACDQIMDYAEARTAALTNDSRHTTGGERHKTGAVSLTPIRR